MAQSGNTELFRLLASNVGTGLLNIMGPGEGQSALQVLAAKHHTARFTCTRPQYAPPES